MGRDFNMEYTTEQQYMLSEFHMGTIQDKDIVLSAVMEKIKNDCLKLGDNVQVTLKLSSKFTYLPEQQLPEGVEKDKNCLCVITAHADYVITEADTPIQMS